MKNKFVAVIVALGGFACLAVMSAPVANAATLTCPPGEAQVGIYCSVLPQGAPSLLRAVLWGAGTHYNYGPTLKFHLKSGINGAPGLVTVKVVLPKGLTVGKTKSRLYVKTFPKAPTSFAFYIKNGVLTESSTLRSNIIDHTTTSLTFKVTVIDAAGKLTALAFTVHPKQ